MYLFTVGFCDSCILTTILFLFFFFLSLILVCSVLCIKRNLSRTPSVLTSLVHMYKLPKDVRYWVDYAEQEITVLSSRKPDYEYCKPVSVTKIKYRVL